MGRQPYQKDGGIKLKIKCSGEREKFQIIRVARFNKIKDAQLNVKFRYRKRHTYTKKLFIVYLKIKVI